MAKDKLSAAEIGALKPREKPYRVFDGGGLYVEVRPNGSKHVRLAYRYQGKGRTLAFGALGKITMEHARNRRDAALLDLAAGRDPSAGFKAGKAVTFGEAASALIAFKIADGASESTIAKARWLLQDLARPLAAVPMMQLQDDAPRIQNLCKGISEAGKRETAIRLRGAIGSVFRHAIREAWAVRDPTPALAGGLPRPETEHHAGVTDADGVGRLLLAIDSYSGSRIVALALKLAPYLFVRPGELRAMTFLEIDRRERRWNIPKGRTKKRRDHSIPLAPQAWAILTQLKELTGGEGYVFPHLRTRERCMSEGTLKSALATIGYGADVQTPHGFRTTASTILHSARDLNGARRFPADVVEFQLAHVQDDKVRGAYDRNTYWEERKAMMIWYADHLDLLRKRARQDVRFEIVSHVDD